MLEGAAFADLLAIDLAYRYSDYSSGITTDTYKVGGEWAPVEDLRLRGSLQRAVRAANIIELFTPQVTGLFNMAFDPCDDPANGNNPTQPSAQIALAPTRGKSPPANRQAAA